MDFDELKQLEEDYEQDMKELEQQKLEDYAKKKEEYNGWTNYETWLVSLHFDEFMYEYFEECEDILLSEAHKYADNLRDIIEDNVSQDLPTGNACPFINAMYDSFMDTVNWQELCQIHLEHVLEDKYEEKIKQSTTN